MSRNTTLFEIVTKDYKNADGSKQLVFGQVIEGGHHLELFM